MKNLKEYVHEIEHLPYEHRKQEHVNLFESKSALSQLVWDIFAHNAYIFYLKKMQRLKIQLCHKKVFTKDRCQNRIQSY